MSKSRQGRWKNSGYIKSSRMDNNLKLTISYPNKKDFFIKLQKLLLKYYDLKIISGEGNIWSKLILPELIENYKTNKRGNSFHNKHTKKFLEKSNWNEIRKKTKTRNYEFV